MREIERFVCPNMDCNFVGISDGECPECGSQLEKPKGDEYRYSRDFDDDAGGPVLNSEYDDDPESVLWYSDGEEGYSTM